MEQSIIISNLTCCLVLLMLQIQASPTQGPDSIPITGTEERDPSKITLKHSIAYHFIKHTRSVEADLFVSRKINLVPISEGLNTIQEVEERVSRLCATIPKFLKEATARYEEALKDKPNFHYINAVGDVSYWRAKGKCDSLGFQLPETYSEETSQELLNFMISNHVPYVFIGTFYDWNTQIHRLISTGLPVWSLHQRQFFLIDFNKEVTRAAVSIREICTNADARFLYDQRGSILVYYENQRGSAKATSPRDNNDFRQVVSSLICQRRLSNKSEVPVESAPHGWTRDFRTIPFSLALASSERRAGRSTRQVEVGENSTTPIQDFCFSVSKHMTETLERSSTRLASLLALVDISINYDSEETEKVKRDSNNVTNTTSPEYERLKRDLLKTGKRLYKVGKAVSGISKVGPMFALTTGFKAVWSLFGFIEKIRTDRRLKSLERAVSRNNEAIDQLSKEVASHSIAIAELNLVTQELTQRLNALTMRVENLEKRVALIETEVKIQQILSFIDSLIERTQSALEYGFIKLESIIHNALSNQASPYLLPPDKLQDIQTQLSKETSGLVDGDYSKMRSVVVAHPDDPTSLLAIANLAALSRKSKELVQLTAIPTYRNGLAIFPQLDYHTVLLDQEGSTFTVIEATEVNSCMADHCITSNPELPVTGSSCGIPQFFERKIDACSYDEKVSDGLFLKRLMSDGVVFSVREETRAQVFCDSQTSKVYKVSGMGTANLPPGCSLILINKSGKSIKINSLPVSRSIGFGDLNLVDVGPEEIFKKAPTSEANGTSTLSKIIENHMEQLNQKLIHTDTALNTQHSYVIILGIFLGLTLVLCTITTTLAYRYSQRFRLKVRTVKEELRTGFEQATEKFKTFENKITQRRNDEFASSFPLIMGMEKQPPEIPPQSLNVLLYKMERLEQRIAQSEGYLNLDDPDIGKKEELYQNLSEVHYVSSPKPTPRLYPPIPSQSEIKMARSTLTRTHHSHVDPSAPKSQSPTLPPKEFR